MEAEGHPSLLLRQPLKLQKLQRKAVVDDVKPMRVTTRMGCERIQTLAGVRMKGELETRDVSSSGEHPANLTKRCPGHPYPLATSAAALSAPK